MDPFRVLLHSVSADLSSGELLELKFLCQGKVGKRKLERVQRAHELFEVLLEQKELDAEDPALLRQLLGSLRRLDLLQRLDDFEAGAAAARGPTDLHAAFDTVCDNVGKEWKRLARQLRVPDAKMDAIEERYPRSLAERVRESLRAWRTAQGDKATVAQLVQALRACQMNLVADLVEEQQQPRGPPNGSEAVSPMSWDSGVYTAEVV